MLIRLLVALLRLPLLPFFLLARALGRPKGRYVMLRLAPSVIETGRTPKRWERFISGVRVPPTRLDRVRELVAAIASDPAREGLVLRIDSLSIGWATAEAIREALSPLALAGKKTIAYLPKGGGEKELFVALACDRILTSPPATFFVPGLESSGLYAAALLERLGIRFERFRRAEFKTAYETLERSSMSEGQRLQVGEMLDGVGAALDAAYQARGRSRASVEDVGLVDAESALTLGLVDALVYEDELAKEVGLTPKKERFLPAGAYLAYKKFRFLPRLSLPRRIAVVVLRGVIGDTGPNSSVESAISALRVAAKDPRTKAIVLHVDSPGGSAFGSDLVHREVVCARMHKPVVASFGDVSASGGYYVSAPADAIVARALTVTGSIGVVAARPAVDGLIEKLGLVRESVGAAPHATLLDPTRPLEERSRAAFERSLDASYKRFVGIVAEGRKRSADEIEPLARGRVYLGSAAKELGLVDGLGGFPEALERAQELASKKDARLPKLEVEVVELPRGFQTEPLVPPASGAARLLELASSMGRPLYFAPDLGDFEPKTELGLEAAARPGLWSGLGALLTMRIPFLSLALVLTLSAIVGCGASVARVRPGAMPENGTYHGVWFSPQYGDMHLCQSGDSVVGEYTKQERHGTIRGTLEGNMLRFQWDEARTLIPGRPIENRGRGYFLLKRDQNNTLAFEGEWGYGDDEVGAGRWTAVIQERQAPDQCYASIRRSAPDGQVPGSDEIRFTDEGTAAPAPTP